MSLRYNAIVIVNVIVIAIVAIALVFAIVLRIKLLLWTKEIRTIIYWLNLDLLSLCIDKGLIYMVNWETLAWCAY